MLYHLTLEFTRATEAEDPYAFATGRQSYLLREAGGVYDGFEIDWDQALLDDLSALARPAPPAEVVTRMGDRLRRILRLAGWESTERELAQAARRGDAIVIDMLSAAAELYSLPWELVPIRAAGVALAELPGVLLRYTWPATVTVGPPVRPEGGHILFAWSDAADPVPWREQERTLREAVAHAAPLAPITLEVLPRATPARLAEALTRRPTLLHLLCHGRSGPTGGLVLTGDDAYEAILDTARLRSLLAPYAQDLRQVVLCACGSGAWSAVASPLGSLAQTVHRLGVPSVVAFRFPVTQVGANQATEALYVGILNMFKSMEQALGDARAALRGGHSLDWAALQLYARAEDGLDTRPVPFRPYRGLLPFGAEHRPYFFGRERVIGEVCDELDQLVQTPGLPDLLFLSGPSGVGKSSLLAAGVLPRLRARWPGLQVVGTRPGATPLATLEAAVAGFKPGPALLVLDQLEELFTLGATEEDRAAWATRLWAILQSGVRCLAAIRGDYLDRLGEIPLPDGRRLDAIAYDDAHRAFIPRLQPDEMLTAIARPAQVVGLALEPGLAERILGDVGGEPGALPLMQHALDQLWQRRDGRALTLRAYEQDIGGVDGALSRHADHVVGALDPADQTLARRMLAELVRWPGEATLATRVRLALSELARRLSDPARIDAVAAALTDARLLVRDGDGDGTTLEIAHEALIRRWPAVQGWLKEGAEARAARDWLYGLAAERAREPGFVLRGAQLGAAVEARRRFGAELPPDLLQFIEASERATEQAQRKARRRVRWTVGISLGAAVVMGLIGWYALRARDQAEEARQRATEETIRARDRGLMAAMRSVPETDELTRALLLREVEHVDEVIGWWEAANAVSHTFFPRERIGPKGTTASASSITWMSDGERIAAPLGNDKVQLLSLKGEDPIVLDSESENEQHNSPFIRVRRAYDGLDWIVATLDSGQVHVWRDLGKQYMQERSPDELDPFRWADISPDGHQLVMVTQHGSITVRDLASGEAYTLSSADPSQFFDSILRGPQGAIAMQMGSGAALWRTTARNAHPEILQTGATITGWGGDRAFSANGSWFAFGEFPDIVHLFPMGDATTTPQIKVPEVDLQGTAFHPHTDRLYVTTGPKVWIYDKESDANPFQSEPDLMLSWTWPRTFHGSAQISPDGAWMVGSTKTNYPSSDTPAHTLFWRSDGATGITHVPGYEMAWDQAFSPDSERLIGTDSADRIWLWDLSTPAEPRVSGSPHAQFGWTTSDWRWAWGIREGVLDLMDLRGEGPPIALNLDAEWEDLKWIVNPPTEVQVSVDGTRALFVTATGKLMVWDLSGGQVPKVVELTHKDILWSSFWGDADHVVVYTEEQSADGIDSTEGDQRTELIVLDLNEQESPRSLATSAVSPFRSYFWNAPDQTWIAALYRDGHLRRWRVADGSVSDRDLGTTDFPDSLYLSADGAWVVWDPGERAPQVLGLDEPNKDATLPVDGSGVDYETSRGPWISPDGSKVAYDLKRQLTVQDLASGEVKTLTLGTVSDVVSWAAFSSDGKALVAAAGQDALVWSLPGGGPPFVLQTSPFRNEELKWVGFSPDGRRVIGLTEHYRYSWFWQPEDLKDWLWRATPYCLPPDERSTLLGENPEDASAHHAACVKKAREAQATSVEQPG